MTKLEGLLSELPTAQRLKIEDDVASLVNRYCRDRAERMVNGKPNRIRLAELDGLLVRMTDEMSDEEIAKRCLNDWADAAED